MNRLTRARLIYDFFAPAYKRELKKKYTELFNVEGDTFAARIKGPKEITQQELNFFEKFLLEHSELGLPELPEVDGFAAQPAVPASITTLGDEPIGRDLPNYKKKQQQPRLQCSTNPFLG